MGVLKAGRSLSPSSLALILNIFKYKCTYYLINNVDGERASEGIMYMYCGIHVFFYVNNLLIPLIEFQSSSLMYLHNTNVFTPHGPHSHILMTEGSD